MNTQKYVFTLKLFPTLLGLTSISVFASLPVLANQSALLSTRSTKQLIAQADAPQELSPEALKVLCKNFPLNSRCTGATTESASTDTPAVAETDAAPEEAVPEADSGATETPVADEEAPMVSPEASDSQPGESADAEPEEMEDTAEGEPDQPNDTPTASDAPTSDPTNTDGEVPVEGGADQPTETPATPDAPADASSSDAPSPPMQAPVTPPVVSPPTVTPPIPGPQGGEGGAEKPESDATDATPTAPTEEAAPEGSMPAETEPPSSNTPPTTPGADELKPEADASPDSQSSISDAELKQFATAIPQLSTVEKDTKGEINQIIGQSGLSPDKFNALYNGQQANTPTVEATDEEKQSFEQAMTKIQAVEQKGQAKQNEIIRAQGLEPQRFGQILAAVRQDQALKTKVQEMLPTN